MIKVLKDFDQFLFHHGKLPVSEIIGNLHMVARVASPGAQPTDDPRLPGGIFADDPQPTDDSCFPEEMFDVFTTSFCPALRFLSHLPIYF
ncbi:unnamed protein product [Gongylonema pulchrum]|uniref:Ovule protein n=1 Tax=Gongylonema pulchrum TaxID=637853 RepID=A0A183DE36_9BILA|nr:unnamed protein product [Gongylonema pulchrum]